MKKVLFVITKSNWGGAQRYVYDLATNLPEEYEAVVALGGNGPLAQKLVAAGIHTIPLDSLERDISIFKDIRSFFALITLFRSEKPDIVHLNSSKAGGVGALAARLCFVPRIVFTAHGWFHNESRPLLARWIAWVLHAVTQILVHITIANSNATKRTAPLPFKIKIIQLARAPDTPLSRDSARSELETRGVMFPLHTTSLCTIGELHKNKGHDILIRALKNVHAPYTLTIIGEGEQRDALQKQILTEHLEHKVFLTGHIDHAASLLPAFDIFVLPSRTESFGYVVVEAGHAGLPVISFNVGGVPEIVSSGKSGILIEPENAEKLGMAITELINSKQLRDTYGTALKQKVVREFTLERMVSETVAVYKN